MAASGLFSMKTSKPLHIFTMKLPSSSSSPSKLKTLFKTFIFSHMCRAARAFAKAKLLLLAHVRGVQFLHLAELKRSKKCKRKVHFSSFRLHYNWCASHVMPIAQESYPDSHIYYDASWNVVIPTSTATAVASPIPDATMAGPVVAGDASSLLDYRESEGLSRYLEWLEEKGNQECSYNEIDKLADLFIADCHEKFRLEKQESYRRSQEMIATSF